MSSELMIQASGIGKAYASDSRPWAQLMAQFFPASKRLDFWALRPLDLEVRRGEVVGVIGQNGSGKSTLLQLLCGTLAASCGQAQIHGRLAALLELGAGFNPQFSGRENIRLSASLYGLTGPEIEQKIPAIIDFADIGDFIDKPVKTYSSGMFVRLAFAVIANVDADILVIDEALAVGDVFFTQKCMRFLQEFAQRGTILFVSHDSASVVSLCNRAILLEHGEVLASGDPKTVTEYYLQRQYDQRQARLPAAQLAADAATTGGVHDAADAPVPDSADTARQGFGLRGLLIRQAQLHDQSGRPLLQLHGSTPVRLTVELGAQIDVEQTLLGFSVKDRLGQVLFGGNSADSQIQLPDLKQGQAIEVAFEFQMPGLTLGDYMISVAAGQGNARQHVMHHWVHDACAFRSTLPVQSGMMALAIDRISYSNQQQS